jgi:hypothetical protein
MISMIQDYLTDLAKRFGQGWNTFWYAPSDPFALGLLRIFAGLMGLYVVGSYSLDLLVFFGPQGILPPELVNELRDLNELRFSYLNYFTQPGELYAVHALGMVLLAMFTVGLWTRVTSILAWIVVLSYIQRAPMLTAQVEPILVFVLFYLCLGPAGKALSVDAYLAKKKSAKNTHSAPVATNPIERYFSATVATRLIQVHLAVVYLMMGISKLAGVEEVPELTWWRGDAVWWMIARPDTRLIDLSGLLAGHSYLVNAWTHAIVLFEICFAILVWNRLARPLLLALAIPMWLSLALISGLAPFALMMLIANLAFFSPAFLRGFTKRPTPAVG